MIAYYGDDILGTWIYASWRLDGSRQWRYRKALQTWFEGFRGTTGLLVGFKLARHVSNISSSLTILEIDFNMDSDTRNFLGRCDSWFDSFIFGHFHSPSTCDLCGYNSDGPRLWTRLAGWDRRLLLWPKRCRWNKFNFHYIIKRRMIFEGSTSYAS